MAATTVLKADLEEKVSDYDEMCLEIVAELDQCDNNRVAQRECLKSIREKIENVYGDSLTDDVDEHLGISPNDDSDIEFSDDEDEEDY